MLQGDLQRAKGLLDEAATLLREEQNGAGLEIVLESQGWVALLQGDHEQAKALHEEGLAIALVAGATLLVVWVVHPLTMGGTDAENAAPAAGSAIIHDDAGNVNR